MIVTKVAHVTELSSGLRDELAMKLEVFIQYETPKCLHSMYKHEHDDLIFDMQAYIEVEMDDPSYKIEPEYIEFVN